MRWWGGRTASGGSIHPCPCPTATAMADTPFSPGRSLTTNTTRTDLTPAGPADTRYDHTRDFAIFLHPRARCPPLSVKHSLIQIQRSSPSWRPSWPRPKREAGLESHDTLSRADSLASESATTVASIHKRATSGAAVHCIHRGPPNASVRVCV